MPKYLLIIPIFIIFSACSKKPKYNEKILFWAFAANLEKNYNKLDLKPKFDQFGRRIYKNILPDKKTNVLGYYEKKYMKTHGQMKKYHPNKQ